MDEKLAKVDNIQIFTLDSSEVAKKRQKIESLLELINLDVLKEFLQIYYSLNGTECLLSKNYKDVEKLEGILNLIVFLDTYKT